MSKQVKLFLLFSRLAMGWLLFYAGITKILDASWSAEPYLLSAKTFPAFYQALAKPDILPAVNFLNEWGLTLLGAALILGAFVRFAGVAGAALMLLYYFPVLDFPSVGTASFIVDQHVIYALVLLLLAVSKSGRYWGLDKRWRGY